MYDVVVVGGGAAGMLAALMAARAGAQTALLERNEKLGKKVYITGKGRCNLTNTADREAMLSRVPRNRRFLYAALSAFSNADVIALIESLGVPTKEERGGRVFPASDKSSDVIRALERGLRAAGVQIRLGARVSELLIEDGRAAGVMLEGGEAVHARRVIVATGGASYPSTGSTGDGWQLAQSTGHATSAPLPALSPIETVESWPGRLSGLTLKNVALRARLPEKKKYVDQGELLFTHFGLSGPLALTLSSLLPEQPAGLPIAIDLKPALHIDTLEARLLRDFTATPNKSLTHIMDGLEPHSLGVELLKLADMDGARKAHSVTAPERRQLAALLKTVPLTVRGLRGLNEAVVTRGGVKVGDINPSTMESKRVAGLFFAGELIDVDALTGGFNLQIAFSTGALAGRSAAAREDV